MDNPTSPSYVPTPAPAPAPVQAPPPAVPPARTSSSKHVLWIVLAVLVVLAGAAYAWMQLNPATPTESPSPSATPTATATATTDPTAGWQTHNSPLGFSMKYPSTLMPTCPAEPSCYLGTSGLDFTKYYTETNVPAGETVISLGSFGSRSEAPITDLLAWRTGWKGGLDDDATYQDTTVAGHVALEENKSESQTIFVATETGVVISFKRYPVTSASEELLNSILPTFVFNP